MHSDRRPYLLDAFIKERQAGILVGDEGALLDESAEALRLHYLAEELAVVLVSTLCKTCTVYQRY